MSSSDQGERRESAKAEECLNTPSKTRDLSEKQFLTKNTISITHLAFFLYWRSFFEFLSFFFMERYCTDKDWQNLLCLLKKK